MTRHQRHLKNLEYLATHGFVLLSVSYTCNFGKAAVSVKLDAVRETNRGDGFVFEYHAHGGGHFRTPFMADSRHVRLTLMGREVIPHHTPEFVFSKGSRVYCRSSWKCLGDFVEMHKSNPTKTELLLAIDLSSTYKERAGEPNP